MTDIPPPEDRALLDALAAMASPAAPEGMQLRFREQLAMRTPGRRTTTVWMAIAATLLIVVSLGWWNEHQNRASENAAWEAQLAASLTEYSTSARLQAISLTVRDARSGKGVEDALVTALLSDESASVRMAAAEALGQIATSRTLTPVLQQALTKETSPFVQLALLQVTDRLAQTDRKQLLQTLLDRKNLDAAVMGDAQDRLTASTMDTPR